MVIFIELQVHIFCPEEGGKCLIFPSPMGAHVRRNSYLTYESAMTATNSKNKTLNSYN